MFSGVWPVSTFLQLSHCTYLLVIFFLVFSPIYFSKLQFQDPMFYFKRVFGKGFLPKRSGMLFKRPWKVILEISIFFWVVPFNFLLHSFHPHELIAHTGLALSHENSLLLKFGWPLYTNHSWYLKTMFTGIQRRCITCSVWFGALDV